MLTFNIKHLQFSITPEFISTPWTKEIQRDKPAGELIQNIMMQATGAEVDKDDRASLFVWLNHSLTKEEAG